MNARVSPLERRLVLLLLAMAVIGLLLSGCTINLHAPPAPPQPKFVNPCDVVDCDRPDINRIA